MKPRTANLITVYFVAPAYPIKDYSKTKYLTQFNMELNRNGGKLPVLRDMLSAQVQVDTAKTKLIDDIQKNKDFPLKTLMDGVIHLSESTGKVTTLKKEYFAAPIYKITLAAHDLVCQSGIFFVKVNEIKECEPFDKKDEHAQDILSVLSSGKSTKRPAIGESKGKPATKSASKGFTSKVNRYKKVIEKTCAKEVKPVEEAESKSPKGELDENLRLGISAALKKYLKDCFRVTHKEEVKEISERLSNPKSSEREMLGFFTSQKNRCQTHDKFAAFLEASLDSLKKLKR